MKKRSYSMEVRAARAEETRARIVEVAQRRFTDPSSELTLEAVATDAGVSVRTVLRAFGSREGLVLAVIDTLRADETQAVEDPPKSVEEAVRGIVEDYERIGDRVVRMLADELRVPGFAEAAAEGRTRHRAWLVAVFADDLRPRRGRARRRTEDALYAATDVYVWKVLRRDLGLERGEVEHVMARLVRGALGNDG